MDGHARFLAALQGEPVDRTPVFPLLMFFAADRAGLSYRCFATNGAALADAQLTMQARFQLDAISACSDAFRVAADLGGEMAYPETKPPHLAAPLVESPDDVDQLGRPDPTAPKGRMGDRVNAIRQMAAAAGGRCAVLGWIEMPFAEACALVGVQQFMMWLVDKPASAHRLLARLTEIEIAFGLAQAAAGADMIGAGDAAASLISPTMYREFALPYQQQVCAALHSGGTLVKLHICGNTNKLLADMATCGADLFNVDHLVPLAKARDVYGPAKKCYKGNLDPVQQMMQATPEQCLTAARACLATAAGTRFMLSPGCEIPADTPDAVLEAFCAAVR